jgi:metal-responsive CopG/Arc/MetJ family transcriptional regulator
MSSIFFLSIIIAHMIYCLFLSIVIQRFLVSFLFQYYRKMTVNEHHFSIPTDVHIIILFQSTFVSFSNFYTILFILKDKTPLANFESVNCYEPLESLTKRNAPVKRICISLSPELLSKFDKSMIKAGYSDRSKAIQTAIHSFIDNYDWKVGENEDGAGAIIMLYDNHVYNQDTKSTQIQHKYKDVISASTHLHLKGIIDWKLLW